MIEASGQRVAAPECPRCHEPSRPAILLFGDESYVESAIFGDQKHSYEQWRQHVHGTLEQSASTRLVVIEIGCGTAVPTVREEAEEYLKGFPEQCSLIRINPTTVPEDRFKGRGLIHIKMGALEAIKRIDTHLKALV